MEPLVILKNQSDHKLPDLVKNLKGSLPKAPAEFSQTLYTSLTTLQPNKSETTQLITYALLATAVVGIMVYHYIRENERSEDLEEELKKRND